jgi:hypothetical protein
MQFESLTLQYLDELIDNQAINLNTGCQLYQSD